jgi:hypothetical protein
VVFAFSAGVAKGFALGDPPVAEAYQWNAPVAVPVLFKLAVLPAHIGATVGAIGLLGTVFTVTKTGVLPDLHPPAVLSTK